MPDKAPAAAAAASWNFRVERCTSRGWIVWPVADQGLTAQPLAAFDSYAGMLAWLTANGPEDDAGAPAPASSPPSLARSDASSLASGRGGAPVSAPVAPPSAAAAAQKVAYADDRVSGL